ncbi:MAG: PP2C family protein-serine/threonine phosphatase [Gemmatimonadota bacterium]
MASEPRLASESRQGRRPYQEDAVLTTTLSDGRILVAVADGMGGHAAGEVASALALETVLTALEEGEELAEAFRRANRAVRKKAEEPGKHGMGTTLVACVVDGGAGTYEAANVGDSRGYVLGADGIRQITRDHSYVAEAMKKGQSEAEAMASPYRDVLTRCIGADDAVEVDVFGPFPIEENTAVLLCSDGMYKVMSSAEILGVFRRSAGPQEAAKALADAAFANQSDDNISVVVAEFGEVPRELSGGTMQLDWQPPPEEDPPAGEESPAGADPLAGEESAAQGWDPAGRSGPPVGLIVLGVVIVVAVIAAVVVMGR